MNALHKHSFLQCKSKSSCTIPLPRPTLAEIERRLRQSAKENRKAVFVCPHCGLVSEYSTRDILEHVIPDTPSPFQSGECILVSIQVDCDGQHCRTPTTVHVIQDTGTEKWKTKIAPKHWTFSDSARCPSGHKLRFDEKKHLHRYPANFPF
jgi:hypothetical protein